MSREDFEVVRAAWEVFSDGRREEFLRHVHPDVELVPFGARMEGKAYRGHAGVREWWDQEIDVNWETFEVHAEEFEDVGERVVVFGHWRARGRTSGVELDTPATWVIEIADGKIRRWQTYTDREEGLRDARAGGPS